MRVLMLNYEYPPLGGGAGNATYYLLREFGKRDDLTVDLVTSSATGRFEEEHPADNITIYKLAVRKKNVHFWTMREIVAWSIHAFRLCNRLIRKKRYDVCHCWFGWPSGMIGFWNRKKIPYLVALRGSDIPGSNPRLKLPDIFFFIYVSKVVWKFANFVTVLSEDSYHKAKKIVDRDFIIIHNGVDTGEFYPGTRKGNGIKILSVGRLTKIKGIEYLIRAFADIRRKYPDNTIHLTIVGRGDIEKQLMHLAQELQISDYVSFSGAVDHKKMPDIYREHDIFILPSINEAQGNVTLEAIASGLAVITTDTGAAELVDTNGFIVKKHDYKEISEKLSILMKNPEVLSNLKKRSVEKAENISWKNCADSYLEIYRSIIDWRNTDGKLEKTNHLCCTLYERQ